MATQHAIKPGASLTQKEMQNIADELFLCETPNSTPGGKPTFMNFDKSEMDKMFGR